MDSSALELYALFGPVEPVVRFIYAVLLRTIFSGYGLLSLFVSEYERRAGRSLRAAVLGKCVKVDIFREIVHNCKLGTATPEARVAQWSAARKAACKTGQYKIAEARATCIGGTINSGLAKKTIQAISKASREDEVQAALEDCGIHNAFLKYLLYRDLRLWFPALPESYEVGPGA